MTETILEAIQNGTFLFKISERLSLIFKVDLNTKMTLKQISDNFDKLDKKELTALLDLEYGCSEEELEEKLHEFVEKNISIL